MMEAAGRRFGIEQVAPPLFSIVTPPNIVCVAPWKNTEPESCEDRQSGPVARPPCAGGWPTLSSLPPLTKA
jgi:hypothetical protein